MITSFTNQNNRANLIHHEIKRRITELTYNPGDKLSEVRIAEELGCGRSPVRTAFTRLQSEGWIEISPQSGTFVRGLTEVEITEILEARMLLEAHLAGRAATRMSEARMAHFRRAFTSFGKRISAERMDDYLELDLQFHLAIYEAAENKVLSTVLLNLSAQRSDLRACLVVGSLSCSRCERASRSMPPSRCAPPRHRALGGFR